MPENASRGGAVDLGMPLMILAFAVIGGFMYWLNGEAQAERALRVVEEVAVEEGSGAEQVSISDLEVDPEPYVGTVVRGVGSPVASMLGTQGFWLATESGNPFLVSWSEALMAEGASVAMGDVVMVEGEVFQMEELVLVEWSTAGTISETDRIVAEFATHFILADVVEVTSGGDAGDGN